MSNVAYPKPFPGLFQTLLGSARSVSEYWDDMFEPWQPKVENRQVAQGLSALSFWDGTELVGGATVIETNVVQPKQSIISRGQLQLRACIRNKIPKRRRRDPLGRGSRSHSG